MRIRFFQDRKNLERTHQRWFCGLLGAVLPPWNLPVRMKPSVSDAQNGKKSALPPAVVLLTGERIACVAGASMKRMGIGFFEGRKSLERALHQRWFC